MNCNKYHQADNLKNPLLGKKPGEDVPQGMRSGKDPGHATERERSLRRFHQIRLIFSRKMVRVWILGTE